MSVLRSPNGGGIGKGLGGSEPNLSLPSDSEKSQITFRNKRKLLCGNEEIMSEISNLNKKMADMMSLLTQSTNTQTENINKLCQDMNLIKGQVNNICTNIDSIHVEQHKLKDEITNLVASTNSTQEKIGLLETDVKLLKSSAGQSTNTEPIIYENFIAECNERYLRGKNIIIVGVQEPCMDNMDIADKQNSDRQEVNKITRMIFSGCPEPERVIRLGKFQHGKTRPIKACFVSEEPVKNVLRNKNNVITGNVKIYSDQTPYQREAMRKLKQELEIRTANGETDLCIKYIKGVPQITIKTAKN